MVHVRFEGRSIDFDERDLRVNARMSDREVIETVSRMLEVAPDRLRFYVVDRVPNGNIVIRPEAVYG